MGGADDAGVEEEMTPERTDEGPLVEEVDVDADVESDVIGVGMVSAAPTEASPLRVSLRRTAPAISFILPILPKASKYISNASLDSSNALLPCPSVVIAIAS
jgi:hypothetical protein